MALLSLAIYLVFALIWYLPLYRKQPDNETRFQINELIKAVFIGMIPAFLVSLVFQSLFALVLKTCGLQSDSLSFNLIMNVIGYAIGEEMFKYLFASRLLKKSGYKSVNNTALLFGAVGAGFGLIESFMFLLANPNIFNAVLRGVVSLHVFLQLWMGLRIGDSLSKRDTDPEGAKKALVSAFTVPLVVHAIQDVSGTLGGAFLTEGSGKELIGAAIMIVSLAVDIVFIIKTIKGVRNSVK